MNLHTAHHFASGVLFRKRAGGIALPIALDHDTGAARLVHT